MESANTVELTDELRKRFAEAADRRFPDAAPSRIAVAVDWGGTVTGWGNAVGRKGVAELLRVIAVNAADVPKAVNASLPLAMKAAKSKSAIAYCPADGLVPLGWMRGKSLYGKNGRYVLYATNGKPAAKPKANDGRGIPER